MKSSDSFDLTSVVAALFREIAELQARSLTAQMICERVLELSGEDEESIRSAAAKIYEDSRDAAMRRTISRLEQILPEDSNWRREFGE